MTISLRDDKGRFIKGHLQLNSGKTHFKKGQFSDEKHFKWKGNNVGYYALHNWIYRKLGKASKCINCGTFENVQWSNVSGKYKRDLEDWQELCRKHHQKYDNWVNKGWKTRRATQLL